MEKKFAAIRNDLLNTSLLVFAFSTFALAASSLYRIQSIGWQPLFLLHVLTIPLTWGLYFFRNRLSFTTRLTLYLGGWGINALAAALQWGPWGNWPITLTILPILTVLFYNRRWGFIIAVVVCLSILPIAFLFIRSNMQINFDPQAYLRHPSAWLFLILNYLMVTLSLIYPIGEMQKTLLANMETLQQNSLALEAGQNELFQTLEFLPVAIGCADTQGNILYTNRAFHETFGYTIAEIPTLDMWFQKAYPTPTYRQSTLETWNADLATIRDGGTASARLYRITTQAGQDLEVEVDAQIVGDRIIAAFNNVTARRQVEQLVAQERRLLRTVIDNLPDAVYAKDTQRRKILANLADLTNIGKPESEVLGKTDDDVFPSESAQRFRADDQIVLETGQAIHNREELLINQQGEKRWLLTTKLPLRDETGQITGLVGIGRDVTDQRQAETALRESAERFRSIVENTDAGYFFIDKDGTLRDINSAWLRLYHFTWPEEVLGRHYLKVQQVADIARAQEIFEGILRGDPHYQSGEFSRQCKDGAIGYHTFSARPVSRGDEVVGIEGFLIDTTEQKQTEAALRLSEQRFRALFEAMTEGVAIHEILYDEAGTPVDYRVIDINPAYTTHTGVTREDVIGIKASELYRISPPPYFDIYEKAAMTGVPAQFETYFAPLHRHFGISVFSPNKGQFATVFEDITMRKHADVERERLLTQIQESAQQLRQIMDTVPEGVLLLGVSGRIVLTNPVANTYLALLAEYQSGVFLKRLGDRPLVELLTAPTEGLWHEITADARHFEAIARPLEDAMEPSGWVLVIRDVTQEREVQRNMQRQERLAVVGQLAAGIAHDFNNILAGIMLYSQMSLRMPDLPPKLRERLTVIEEQSHRASDLINQILDFSRRAVLDRRPLDLVPFVKEQVKLWKHTLPENIHITLTCAEDAYIVNADLTRMQQMLINLVVNARDAMPDGGDLRITLAQVRVKNVSSAPLPEMAVGEWVRVSITDTGSGIPDAVLARLFTPFFTTKAPGKGTGLGLAQVYGIVAAHEGRIDVKSAVNVGTTFDIYLPLLKLPETTRWLPDDSELPLGNAETILVVEDNATTRAALVESLELLHYRVLEASDGAAALEIFAQQQEDIALVLSDMVMPAMGGKALAQALHQRNPALPVIVVSGHPLDQENETLQLAGVTAWLQKPPGLEQLAETLARVLGRK
ncbi:MAG TPA: PAS domain S-box protein [Anaerolineae bacterium]|nr:PAS domain S-box protein [Anaerolineae bacterium]